MSIASHTNPNAEQIQYWNETAGPKWVALHDAINTQIAPLGVRAMEYSRVASGEQVLDIGCGCGETTIDLAHRVGPAGAVTGVDISEPMLARAQQSMLQAGMRHVHFVQADAQTHVLPSASFDLLYSRFGVMFFIDPLAAFANLATALRPGGRLTFICWQALQHNPWMFVPMAAAASHLPLPAPSDPTAPGPFAFADPQRVRSLLTSAGFRGVECHDLKAVLTLGNDNDLDRTVEFALQMGPTGSALRAHPAARERVTVAVRDALRPYHSHDGVRMEAAAWIVTAQRA